MELLKIENSVFLEMDKTELNAIGENAAIKDIDSGNHDSSKLLVTAKKVVEILGGYVRALNSSVTDELYNNGTKNVLKVHGSEITLSSTGTRYDYEADPEYMRLKEALKEREKWLKMASTGKAEVVIEGAVVEPVPIKIQSKEIIKIKL